MPTIPEQLATWAKIRSDADDAIELLGYVAATQVRLNQDKPATAVTLTQQQKQPFKDAHDALVLDVQAQARALG